MSRRRSLLGKVAFVDLLLNMLNVVTALLIVSNAVKKQKELPPPPAPPAPPAVECGLKTQGEHAVLLTWPDQSEDDVDLYVRDPNGKVVYFDARELELIHLERDDQGLEKVNVAGQRMLADVQRNEERTIILNTVPGEYVVNVHMYKKHGREPVPVVIRLVSLKGEDREIERKERVLKRDGDEVTAFRFTAKDDGTVGDLNENPVALTKPRSNAANPFGPRGGR